jgi:hypothetical protein
MAGKDEANGELEAILGLDLDSPEVRLWLKSCARMQRMPVSYRKAAMLRMAEELQVTLESLQDVIDKLSRAA